MIFVSPKRLPRARKRALPGRSTATSYADHYRLKTEIGHRGLDGRGHAQTTLEVALKGQRRLEPTTSLCQRFGIDRGLQTGVRASHRFTKTTPTVVNVNR